MEHFVAVVSFLIGFFIISISADKISQFFKKIHFPVITGLLITGIISGPYVLNMIKPEAILEISFLNDITLAFIAFAAGTELYLKELRDNLKSIYYNTTAQLVVTFVISSLSVFYLAEYIPFMQTMSVSGRFAVAILAGSIFIARSPSSSIAIIQEMRAKGPLTKTALGVTVIIDVLVIIIFAISFSVATNLFSGEDLNLIFLIDILAEIILAFVLGFILGELLKIVMKQQFSTNIKAGLLLILGAGVYLFSHYIFEQSIHFLPFSLHIEPLLVCIIGSFIITNYTSYRPEFQKIIHDLGPTIYVIFFTLTGASMSLDVLSKIWEIAIVLFVIRLGSMIIGSYIGGTLAKDPPDIIRVGWMPYVTQAGVGIGLATAVIYEFPEWGTDFYTLIIGVIVIGQMVGPPLFKFSIKKVGEAHTKHGAIETHEKKAVIIGLETQSLAIAKQLELHKWTVQILTRRSPSDYKDITQTPVTTVKNHSLEALQASGCTRPDAIILLLSDEENYKLCEMVYEHLGTKNVVVRLNNRENFEKFHELGALIVEPSTAVVSLVDNFVRSPIATSLLLGLDSEQESMDIEVEDKAYHGIALKYLRLPEDIIILSVKRNNHVIISHGYTKLRIGDILTVIGSPESLENVSLTLGR